MISRFITVNNSVVTYKPSNVNHLQIVMSESTSEVGLLPKHISRQPPHNKGTHHIQARKYYCTIQGNMGKQATNNFGLTPLSSMKKAL